MRRLFLLVLLFLLVSSFMYTVKASKDFVSDTVSDSSMSKDSCLGIRRLPLRTPNNDKYAAKEIDRRQFVNDTICKLKGLNMSVKSFQYISDSNRMLIYENEHITICMPIDSKESMVFSESKREFVFEWIKELKDRGYKVNSFNYSCRLRSRIITY